MTWDADAYADAEQYVRDVELAERHEADDGWTPDPIIPEDVLTPEELRQYYRERRRRTWTSPHPGLDPSGEPARVR